MQVQVEELSNLKRRLTIVIPAEEIDSIAENKLEQLKSKVKLPGFRPGKIPTPVMQQRYGQSVRRDVITDKIQSSYFDAIEKEHLRPAGLPKIDPKDSDFGQALEYTATLEVLPKIDLKELTGEKITKLNADITDQDVDKIEDKFLKDQAVWNEVSDAAKEGNRLEIDFEGKIKDEIFEGGSAKNYTLELGAGTMLEDFEKPLIGAKPGDTIKVKLKFPKDYGDEKVSGKKAEFDVKVNKVFVATLPELNEEFFKKINMENGSQEKLKKELRDNMERQLQQVIATRFKDDLLNKFLEINSVELPEVMLDQEMERMKLDLKKRMAQYAGKKVEDLPDVDNKEVEEEAKRRVKLGLLMGELINKHQLKADQAKIQEKMQQMAGGHEKSAEILKFLNENPKYLADFESMVLEEQVIEELEKQVQIEENKVSFDEAVMPKKS